MNVWDEHECGHFHFKRKSVWKVRLNGTLYGFYLFKLEF